MLGSRSLSFLRWVSCGAAVALASSCHDGIDTTRKAPAPATLGDDIFGMLCDRVAAGVLGEDLTGESYHAVCHYDDDGKYADEVETKLLPPVKGEKAKRNRQRSVAKVHAMARRRGELIRALNAIFPDIEIPDVTTKEEGDVVDMHDALFEFAQAITPLYEDNPLDPEGEPLLPTSTRSLGRLFDALALQQPAESETADAPGAFARIWARQGYRPFPVGLGAIRAGLAYPKLRDLTLSSLKVLGPDGVAVEELQQLLAMSKRQMLASKPIAAPLPQYVVDPNAAQPNRPRTNVEVAAALMLAEDPSFAKNDADPPRFIARRDRRGLVIPAGSTPGAPGSIPAPFADLDGDGFADVDAFGRFVDGAGAPLAVDPPFLIPSLVSGPVDEFGRPATPLYTYVDTSRSFTGALSRSMVTLLDSTQTTTPGDPDAWKVEHETLMYMMGGAYMLYGDREDALYDFDAEAILPPDGACALGKVGCAPYSRFRGEDSPMPKLAHATGQILADSESDAILLALMDLIENHEQVVARLVGAALRVKAIADAHDEIAAQGQQPKASLPYETPIWDEMAGVLSRISQRPGLTAKLIGGLADPANVTPTAGAQHYGDMLAIFASMRDALTYDPQNLNGPAINVTIGGGSTTDPMTPVDFNAPRIGDNRSMLQRTLQLIHDTNGVRGCNKQGAFVYSNILGLDAYWPLAGSGYDQCDLFQIENMAAFYLDSMLEDPNHPKRSKFVIKASDLNAMLNFIGVSNTDTLLQDSSGIAGMTTTPTPQALNRLVFFGADSTQFPSMPDDDGFNQDSNTNKFVSNLQEPMASVVCPKTGSDFVNSCSSMNDTLRVRDAATIFLWERLGFYEYMRPMLTVFANECTNAASCELMVGELMFLDLQEILHRHWAGPDHGPECEKQGTAATNPRFCSEAGAYAYEPILTEALRTDLVPALHEFAKVAMQIQVTIQRGPQAGQTITGADVLEKVTRIMFDTDYAASVGMVDRFGGSGATWVDGTAAEQLTPFTLFADALHGIDTRFDDTCGCAGQTGDALDGCRESCVPRGQWRRARSQLVDELFAVDSEAEFAKFRNRSTPRMLLTVMRVLREQLNANCPDRESTGQCAWAREDLGDKIAETLSGPLFAAMMDLQEQIRLDEGARRELERFLAYVLEAAADDDSLQAMLASASDILQVLADDDEMSALFNAAATAATPATEDDPGCADTTIRVMKALTDDRFDKYHVLDLVLPRLVTPMDEGQNVSPLEVFLDTIADVNRVDADDASPLESADYAAIMGTLRDFFVDERRGLEQFYYVVQRRPRE